MLIKIDSNLKQQFEQLHIMKAKFWDSDSELETFFDSAINGSGSPFY